ncbi:hypothetical protein ACFQI7_19175 [Paenibacillus allorhizosphaerae]|uniref:Glycoside hydrolase n=1 Tax=Paenibacillus allorhizosphaerae TaxID=2849866 RepID=A0ABM8VNS8_9BACL|nr:hypothetical protein [Paenibacillus allorhizosphaerae]CAG7651929.1 hypothetical protein PAECIP111802_05093 [Paenibacillus allorhizosphaerae]
MKNKYLIVLTAGAVLAAGAVIAGLNGGLPWRASNQEVKEITPVNNKDNDGNLAAQPVDKRLLNNLFRISSGPDQGKKVPLYDGTIEKYNGYYYAAGTGTSGTLYRSKDMIHWEGPVRFISNDPATLPKFAGKDGTFTEYGASDFYYHNGVMFYGFNSNNLIHGRPDTMHTDKPQFQHSFTEEQFDTGIDLQFMVAHNGDLLYLRKANPAESNPNTGEPLRGKAGVWLWKVQSFFNERGNPGRSLAKELLHTQPGHWGNINFVNFEGPEMYYHNGQYYLLYAANQMFPETGLYETGAAQATNYDAFTNASKYPGKLLARNLERLLLHYKVLLPTSEHGSQTYTYTYDQPAAGWEGAAFDDFSWKKGEGGFGWPTHNRARIPSIYNGGVTSEAQMWGAPKGPAHIWTRRTFKVDIVPEKAVLRHRLQGEGKIYINGKLVTSVKASNRAYQFIEIPAGLLKKGDNVIAADAVKLGSNPNHLDYGVFDTNGMPVEPDIVGPTQPNVIKGPNGFETWAVYKAFWNSENGQGKDRLFFWGDEMVADGVTSGQSPGMHFDAFLPTFEDRYDSTDSMGHYENVPEGVSVKDGALLLDASGQQKQVLLKGYTGANFFLETNIRFDGQAAGKLGQAGVTVWYKDEANAVRLLVDRDKRQLIVSGVLDGKSEVKTFELPYTFKFLEEDVRVSGFGEQYHTLKVYKNGSRLFAELDHYKLNNDRPVVEDERLAGPGKIGMAASGSKVSMDNTVLTTGWSEYKSYVNGWDASWSITGDGLKSPAGGKALTVKGDRVSEHEFSVNVDSVKLPKSGEAGIVVAYVDESNYVVAYTDFAAKQHVLRQVKDGKETVLAKAPTTRYTIYGHSNYDGQVQKEYVYNVQGAAQISQAKILWTAGEFDYLNTTFQLPESSSSSFGLDSRASAEGKWEALPVDYQAKGKGDYNIADFKSAVTAGQLRLRVPAANNRPFSFALREEISSQNFYRTVRLDGRLFVWVNNRLLFNMEDPFANKPAQAGLYTNNCEALFDSITAFEIGEAAK